MAASMSKVNNRKALKQVNALKNLAMKEMEANQKSNDNTPIVENVAWLTQRNYNHTCKSMYDYILTHDLLSPMSIAAVWRMIQCKKCNFVYHPRIAASPSLAEYYIRFGGDMKILHTIRPKLLIRDLPSIKSVVAKGIKVDPKMKSGAVKCIADNLYVYEQLGDTAILAGMIDPAYVDEDVTNPLFQRLLYLKAYDSLPPKMVYDIMVAENENALYIDAFFRIELANIVKDPDFDKTRTIWLFCAGAIPDDGYIQKYLYSYDHGDEDVPNKLFNLFIDENAYKTHTMERTKSLSIDPAKAQLDKNVKIVESDNILEYLRFDIYDMMGTNVNQSDDKRYFLLTYSDLIKNSRGRGELIRDDRKMLEKSIIDIRVKLFGKDWRDKPTMTTVQIRAMLIERFKQKCLKDVSWTFSQFNNCDFDDYSTGAHPTVTSF